MGTAGSPVKRETGWRRLKEHDMFLELKRLDHFCTKNSIQYAFFGGVATAGFLGEFVRPLHDIDVVIAQKDLRIMSGFLRLKGFRAHGTHSSQKAGFRRFSKRTPAGEIVIQVFPGLFKLLDGTNGRRLLWAYDFSYALDRAQSRTMHSLDRSQMLSLRVIPLEDLLLSKLWPYFESNMVFDLALLLRFVV